MGLALSKEENVNYPSYFAVDNLLMTRVTVIYTDSAVYSLLIVLISLLSILTAYFTVYIQYFFMDKNMNLVKQMYPDFGIPKNERAEPRKKKKK